MSAQSLASGGKREFLLTAGDSVTIAGNTEVTTQYAGTSRTQKNPASVGPFQKDALVLILATSVATFTVVDGTVGQEFSTAEQASLRGLVAGAGNLNRAAFSPWRIAPAGDSRSNTGSSGPDVYGSQLISDIRSVTWAAAYLGDCEIVRNYGVSGDAASGWASPSRTGGKTYLDLDAADLDLVVMQYGVNDAMAGTNAATLYGYLRAFALQILKSNKRLVFEAIHPIGPAVSNYVTYQAVIDSVNQQMATFLGLFPGVARYCDTASILKDVSGYAADAYYNTDDIHLIRPGAMAAGAVLANTIREMLPPRRGLFPAPDARAANLINVAAPNAFIAVEAGTTSAQAITSGSDERGAYVQFDITPATFVSGEFRARLEISANFHTSTTPYGSLAGTEIIGGYGRIVIDNGSGGAPNVYAFGVRHRYYTGSVFRDWGFPGTQLPGYAVPNFSAAVDVPVIVPGVATTTASVSAAPSSGGGWQLQTIVNSSGTTPFRVRVYQPQLRRIGYHGTPISVTPPASGSPYTNTSQGVQQVSVYAGTVTAIAINGVATGATSGTFLLSPGDTLTPTHSSAPTMIVKQVV